MKQRIKLAESELHKIIKNSVLSILNEYIGDAGEYGIYPNDEDPTFNPHDREQGKVALPYSHDQSGVGEPQYDPTDYSSNAIADNQIVNEDEEFNSDHYSDDLFDDSSNGNENLLSEEFNFKGGYYLTKSKTQKPIIIIDPKLSEKTFNYRQDIKKYQATWISEFKTWGWALPAKEKAQRKVIDEKVKPCIAFLLSVEKKSPDNTEERTVESVLQEILKGIHDFQMINPEVTQNPKVVLNAKKQMAEMEKKIAEGMHNEKADEFVKNLAQFRNKMKLVDPEYDYSYMNTFTIYILKPDAREVHPLGQWKYMGWGLKDPQNATSIPLIGWQDKARPFTKEEKTRVIADYLRKYHVNTVQELPKRLQWDLKNRHIDKGVPLGGGNYYVFEAYDISDMKPVKPDHDKREIPEEEKVPDNWWFMTEKADEKDIALTEAGIMFAESKECGCLDVSMVKSLNRARGNATSTGKINIVKDKNDYKVFPTLVHEITHQLRHFNVAATNNPKLAKFVNPKTYKGQEHEAEFCAAFVTDFFGYDIQHECNYLRNWELPDDRIREVCETVAEVADFIVNGVLKYLPSEKPFIPKTFKRR